MMRPVLLLLSFLGVTLAGAQTVTISGAVRDAHYGDPIVGAPVYLVGTLRVAVTNGIGRYVLRDVPAGTFIITVAYKGYTSESVTLVSSGEADVNHDFNLMRAPMAREAAARSPQTREQEGRQDPAASRIQDALNAEFNTVCGCFKSAIGVLNDAVRLRRRYENIEQYERDHEAVGQMNTLMKSWRTAQQYCLTRFGTRLLVDSACNRPGEISDRRRVLDSLGIKM